MMTDGQLADKLSEYVQNTATSSKVPTVHLDEAVQRIRKGLRDRERLLDRIDELEADLRLERS